MSLNYEPSHIVKLVDVISTGASVLVEPQLFNAIKLLVTDRGLNSTALHMADTNRDDGLSFVGYPTNPEIQTHLVSTNKWSRKCVDLVKSISCVSGKRLLDVFFEYEAHLDSGNEERLMADLDHWRWCEQILLLPTDISKLDLTTLEGVVRAFQLQRAIGVKSDGINIANEYYHVSQEVYDAEMNRLLNNYDIQIRSIDYVLGEDIAKAILEKDADTLCMAFGGGLNKSYQEVFLSMTGVKLRGAVGDEKCRLIREWAALEKGYF